MSLLKGFCRRINHSLRYRINLYNRKKLHNRSFTLITNNCTGGFILNDLQQRFNSPFINLYLTPSDFIRYLKNITFYQQQTLAFISSDKTYPVGKLCDIYLHFMHYHTEQEAKEKWQQRSMRMNLDNLFIIMVERDGCTYDDLQAFDQLPFPHKVVFTHKTYPDIRSAFKISGFEHQHMVGDVFDYCGVSGKRYYDQFDYIRWFNRENER